MRGKTSSTLPFLGQLPQGKLIASHDLDFILTTYQRFIVFDRTIIADGPTEQLLAQTELMEQHGLEVPWRLR